MGTLLNRFDISVIVPTYNRSELLDYTFRSLLQQEIDKNRVEVIIADDGSSDDTREIVRKYEDSMNVKYVFQEDKGYRPASARNKGLVQAEGNICLFIDSGILLDTDCLKDHVDFHRKKGPKAAAVGYVYGFDRIETLVRELIGIVAVDDPGGSIRKIMNNESFYDVREEHYQIHKDRIHQLPAPWLYFWTGNVSVSRENIEKAGMFDESYDGRWGCEDSDLGFRLFQMGVGIYLLRSARCIHYPHNTSKPEKVSQGRQNCAYFDNKFQTLATGLFLKNFGGPKFVDINSIIMEIDKKTIS